MFGFDVTIGRALSHSAGSAAASSSSNATHLSSPPGSAEQVSRSTDAAVVMQRLRCRPSGCRQVAKALQLLAVDGTTKVAQQIADAAASEGGGGGRSKRKSNRAQQAKSTSSSNATHHNRNNNSHSQDVWSRSDLRVTSVTTLSVTGSWNTASSSANAQAAMDNNDNNNNNNKQPQDDAPTSSSPTTTEMCYPAVVVLLSRPRDARTFAVVFIPSNQRRGSSVAASTSSSGMPGNEGLGMVYDCSCVELPTLTRTASLLSPQSYWTPRGKQVLDPTIRHGGRVHELLLFCAEATTLCGESTQQNPPLLYRCVALREGGLLLNQAGFTAALAARQNTLHNASTAASVGLRHVPSTHTAVVIKVLSVPSWAALQFPATLSESTATVVAGAMLVVWGVVAIVYSDGFTALFTVWSTAEGPHRSGGEDMSPFASDNEEVATAAAAAEAGRMTSPTTEGGAVELFTPREGGAATAAAATNSSSPTRSRRESVYCVDVVAGVWHTSGLYDDDDKKITAIEISGVKKGSAASDGGAAGAAAVALDGSLSSDILCGVQGFVMAVLDVAQGLLFYLPLIVEAVDPMIPTAAFSLRIPSSSSSSTSSTTAQNRRAQHQDPTTDRVATRGVTDGVAKPLVGVSKGMRIAVGTALCQSTTVGAQEALQRQVTSSTAAGGGAAAVVDASSSSASARPIPSHSELSHSSSSSLLWSNATRFSTFCSIGMRWGETASGEVGVWVAATLRSQSLPPPLHSASSELAVVWVPLADRPHQRVVSLQSQAWFPTVAVASAAKVLDRETNHLLQLKDKAMKQQQGNSSGSGTSNNSAAKPQQQPSHSSEGGEFMAVTATLGDAALLRLSLEELVSNTLPGRSTTAGKHTTVSKKSATNEDDNPTTAPQYILPKSAFLVLVPVLDGLRRRVAISVALCGASPSDLDVTRSSQVRATLSSNLPSSSSFVSSFPRDALPKSSMWYDGSSSSCRLSQGRDATKQREGGGGGVLLWSHARDTLIRNVRNTLLSTISDSIHTGDAERGDAARWEAAVNLFLSDAILCQLGSQEDDDDGTNHALIRWKLLGVCFAVLSTLRGFPSHFHSATAPVGGSAAAAAAGAVRKGGAAGFSWMLSHAAVEAAFQQLHLAVLLPLMVAAGFSQGEAAMAFALQLGLTGDRLRLFAVRQKVQPRSEGPQATTTASTAAAAAGSDRLSRSRTQGWKLVSEPLRQCPSVLSCMDALVQMLGSCCGVSASSLTQPQRGTAASPRLTTVSLLDTLLPPTLPASLPPALHRGEPLLLWLSGACHADTVMRIALPHVLGKASLRAAAIKTNSSSSSTSPDRAFELTMRSAESLLSRDVPPEEHNHQLYSAEVQQFLKVLWEQLSMAAAAAAAAAAVSATPAGGDTTSWTAAAASSWLLLSCMAAISTPTFQALAMGIVGSAAQWQRIDRYVLQRLVGEWTVRSRAPPPPSAMSMQPSGIPTPPPQQQIGSFAWQKLVLDEAQSTMQALLSLPC